MRGKIIAKSALKYTLIPSPPSRVTGEFAQKLAQRSGSIMIDVDSALYSIFEWKTEVGVRMSNMVLKEQVASFFFSSSHLCVVNLTFLPNKVSIS